MEPLPLPILIERRSGELGDRQFLVFEGATLTYAEAARAARRAAAGYRDLGVGRGDRVLLMIGNRPEWIEAWWGLAALGAIEVPVNPAYRGAPLVHQINDCMAEVMVIERANLGAVLEVVDQVPGLHTLVVIDEQSGSRQQIGRLQRIPFSVLRGRDELLPASTELWDTAAIMYTSGTTGRAKGVVCPWGQVYTNSNSPVEAATLQENGRLLLHMPMFHIGGQWFGLAGCLIAGATLILGRRFSASSYWSEAKQTGATAGLMVGAMANFLLKQPARESDRDHSIQRIVCTPAPAEFKEFEGRFGVRLGVSYGSTEATTPIGEPEPDDPGMCGRLRAAEFDAIIADPFDRPVPNGTIGELLLRPRAPWTTMTEYWRQPEETVRVWRNGWLHTGDAFRCDGDGRYFFVDRLRDSIRHRGENISATELEAAALAFDAVEQAAAVGVPADEGEEEVKLCVRARRGFALSPSELVDYLAERLPAFMVPRYIEILDAFPMTETEKVRKQELRDRGISGVWDRLGR